MSLSRAKRSGITVSTTPKKSRSLTDASGLPGPVQNLSASTVSVNEISLSWSPPSIVGDSSVSGYVVGTTAGSASVSGTSAIVSGLNPQTLYNFTVTAQNSLGNGITSAPVSASTAAFNSATGGSTNDVSNYNGTGQTWRVHTFTSGGTLTVTNAQNPFRVLVVAGGGGGGNDFGGGGGGGGMLEQTTQTLSTTSYTVTVGNGGGDNSNGGASSLGSVISTVGGGGGGTFSCNSGKNGGSGGGASGALSACGNVAGQGTPFQGHNGAGGSGQAGAGGGAGNSEASTSHTSAGRASTITGSSVTYASGGCAVCNGNPGTIGGGGGGGIQGGGHDGKPGAAGRVIVSYRIS